MSATAPARPALDSRATPGRAAGEPAAPARSDERHLLLRYRRDGDVRARDELVRRFLPLARQLARRYQRGSEPLDDLIQVACLGLVKAVDRFDVERTTAFSSYAVPTMVGELKRYLRDFGWAVHVPRGMQERVAAVQGAVDRLTRDLGHSPAAGEIARELELSEEHVLEALEAGRAHRSVSLDAPRPGGGDPDESTAGDALGADDERFELIELGVSIMPALRELPERDRRTLHLRFVEDMTQSQIAAEIGVSQMHVSRLIRRSLAQVAEATEGGDAGDRRAAAGMRAA